MGWCLLFFVLIEAYHTDVQKMLRRLVGFVQVFVALGTGGESDAGAVSWADLFDTAPDVCYTFHSSFNNLLIASPSLVA
jgi:hypothetical protein